MPAEWRDALLVPVLKKSDLLSSAWLEELITFKTPSKCSLHLYRVSLNPTHTSPFFFLMAQQQTG